MYDYFIKNCQKCCTNVLGHTITVYKGHVINASHKVPLKNNFCCETYLVLLYILRAQKISLSDAKYVYLLLINADINNFGAENGCNYFYL